MDKIVITGGAGFIGSHVVERFVKFYSDVKIVVVDKLTYAADYNYLSSVSSLKNYEFCQGDISDLQFMLTVTEGADAVVNLAAESHVDNSFQNSLPFCETNTFGTHVILQCCLLNDVGYLLHVSTDEVYGENNTDTPFTEIQNFNPTNPYSASKAAAEMFVKSFESSYGLKATIVRANNIFGPRQYPEKLIPRSILRLKNGLPALIHGDGKNKRCFLHVDDFCEALILLFRNKFLGVFNIASSDEHTNLEVIRFACNHLGLNFDESVKFVKDRPHNDSRYLINSDKIQKIGWSQTKCFSEEINSVFDWYLNHNYTDDQIARL